MVLEKLKGIIAQQFGVDQDEITEETTFVGDLGADSLDLVELIMSVEDAFELGQVEDMITCSGAIVFRTFESAVYPPCFS